MSTQLSKVEIQQQFKQAEDTNLTARYKKFRQVDARKADTGEVIVTYINGEAETKNTADTDGIVVMNMTTKSREQYILTAAIFAKRYQNGSSVSEDWGTFQPIGEVDGFEWTGDTVEFDAPWGELMIMHKGDFLCKVPGSEDDIYRIARTEFFETYKAV